MPRRKRTLADRIARIGLADLVGLILAYIVTRAFWLIYQPGPTWAFVITMIGMWLLYRIVAALLPYDR